MPEPFETDRFYLVYTKTNMEASAAAALKADGVTVYLPQYLKKRRHARRLDVVPAPLFPRYMFALRDPAGNARVIRSARGVADMVKRDGEPALVRPEVIEQLRKREVDGYITIADRSEVVRAYEDGETLKIVDEHSAFDGVLVRFMRLSHSDRALVSLAMFATPRSMEIGLEQLQRI